MKSSLPGEGPIVKFLKLRKPSTDLPDILGPNASPVSTPEVFDEQSNASAVVLDMNDIPQLLSSFFCEIPPQLRRNPATPVESHLKKTSASVLSLSSFLVGAPNNTSLDSVTNKVQRDYCTGEHKATGLKNMGATCYANAYLQLLFHNQLLRRNILLACQNESACTRASIRPVVSSLQQLLAYMLLTKRKSISPEELLIGVLHLSRDYQQDSAEFLKLLLQNLCEDGNTLTGSEPPAHSNSWKDVASLMTGEFTYSISKCIHCDSELAASRSESFTELNIPIEKEKQSLTDGIALICREEIIDERTCPVCQLVSPEPRRFTAFTRLPRVLNIQILRFQYDRVKNIRTKIRRIVQIPMKLSIDGKTYSLQGAIRHKGSSASSGHYVVDVLNSKDSSTWIECDDISVTTWEVPPFESKSSAQAYYITYVDDVEDLAAGSSENEDLSLLPRELIDLILTDNHLLDEDVKSRIAHIQFSNEQLVLRNDLVHSLSCKPSGEQEESSSLSQSTKYSFGDWTKGCVWTSTVYLHTFFSTRPQEWTDSMRDELAANTPDLNLLCRHNSLAVPSSSSSRKLIRPNKAWEDFRAFMSPLVVDIPFNKLCVTCYKVQAKVSMCRSRIDKIQRELDRTPLKTAVDLISGQDQPFGPDDLVYCVSPNFFNKWRTLILNVVEKAMHKFSVDSAPKQILCDDLASVVNVEAFDSNSGSSSDKENRETPMTGPSQSVDPESCKYFWPSDKEIFKLAENDLIGKFRFNKSVVCSKSSHCISANYTDCQSRGTSSSPVRHENFVETTSFVVHQNVWQMLTLNNDFSTISYSKDDGNSESGLILEVGVPFRDLATVVCQGCMKSQGLVTTVSTILNCAETTNPFSPIFDESQFGPSEPEKFKIIPRSWLKELSSSIEKQDSLIQLLSTSSRAGFICEHDKVPFDAHHIRSLATQCNPELFIISMKRYDELVGVLKKIDSENHKESVHAEPVTIVLKPNGTVVLSPSVEKASNDDCSNSGYDTDQTQDGDDDRSSPTAPSTMLKISSKLCFNVVFDPPQCKVCVETAAVLRQEARVHFPEAIVYIKTVSTNPNTSLSKESNSSASLPATRRSSRIAQKQVSSLGSPVQTHGRETLLDLMLKIYHITNIMPSCQQLSLVPDNENEKPNFSQLAWENRETCIGRLGVVPGSTIHVDCLINLSDDENDQSSKKKFCSGIGEVEHGFTNTMLVSK